MTFKIKHHSWVDVWDRPIDPGPGYNADDYLPGFAEREFASSGDAVIWLVQNYKGSDVDGIGCSYEIVSDGQVVNPVCYYRNACSWPNCPCGDIKFSQAQ